MSGRICRVCKQTVPPNMDRCPFCSAPTGEGFSLEDPIGMEFGGCRVEDILGKGSFGAVYWGHHAGLRREVAVKIVPMEEGKKELLRQLVMEARTIARIEHPNIVQVHDVGIRGPYLYITMQLIKGESLADRLREGFVSRDDAVEIVRQVACGLQAAHERGVVHRDIKPENVMLAGELCKLVDFGMALNARELDAFSGRVVGTPHYIPPEAWVGKPVDGRGDLYALGMIFYWMLVGRLPFRPATLTELQKLHLKGKPTPPIEASTTVDEPLSRIVMKLLEKDPARRYSGAGELLQDLARYRRGEEVTAFAEVRKTVPCRICEAANSEENARCDVCGEPLRPPTDLL